MATRELCGVADMMRWEILERYGGFAVDADSVCVRPLADWLFEPEIFACWENEIARPGLIANGYVYSHPGNRLIRQLVNDIHNPHRISQPLFHARASVGRPLQRRRRGLRKATLGTRATSHIRRSCA
jgi:mannosyltransferase OCH1-like enzyme